MVLFELWPIQSGKVIALVFLVLLFILTIFYMRGDRPPFIRRVMALDAMEEAVGRATEMGKPVVCSFGWAGGSFDYWTLAGLSILSHISQICAKDDTRLIVPTGGSRNSFIVRPVAVDIVRGAYIAEDKLDQFDENDMPFLSAEQFAMGTGFAGILISEKPAAMVLCGSGGADVMMVIEVSNQIGALTIASGSYMSNVACTAAACDYIMIGEESIAAGAYLSGEPAQLASMRTSDIFKGLAIILSVVGWFLLAIGSTFLNDLLGT